MTLLYIDGVAMPSPTKYHVGLEDIDASTTGRNDAGILKRDVVRRKVPKIELGWEMLTDSELTTIANAIQDKMQVTYYWGTTRTDNMYAGGISIDLTAIPNGNDYRWSVSFDLISY